MNRIGTSVHSRSFASNKPLVLCCALMLLGGCGSKDREPPDHPRISSKVILRDVAFRSAALGREMRYRALLPAIIAPDRKLPAVYLLHGSGGNFRDWSNYSDVSRFGEANLILVMPQGDDSWYVNAAERPRNRYEDYIVQDLISDAQSRFPIARDRPNRAIAGISMGGYGAIKLALSHPDLFVFAGALSGAFDAPGRPFSIRRIRQSRAYTLIFGPWGSDARRRADPFVLARSADAANVPYLFLSCGNAEGLLPVNREFADVLTERNLQYEFQAVPGGHDWTQWSSEVPALFESLLQHLAIGK